MLANRTETKDKQVVWGSHNTDLGLEHVVLNRASAQQALQEDYGETFFVVLGDRDAKFGCRRTHDHGSLAVLCWNIYACW